MTDFVGYCQRVPRKGREGVAGHLRSRSRSLGQAPYPQSFLRRVQGLLLEDEG